MRQRALSVLRDAMNKVVDPQLQIVDVPVPQVVEDLVEVSKVFPQNRVQQRFLDQTIETPALSLAVKIAEVPVIQTQRKTQQIVNTHVQHVVNTIEVEKAIIQVKINQGTMHIETPELQFLDKVDDMPVVVPRQVSMVPKSQKTIKIPPLQKTVETPETQMIQSAHTSESLRNAPVHQVAQGEIVEAVVIEVPLPAESASLMSVTEPVSEVPPVVVECMQPVPVAEYVEPAPAHAATCAHAASVVKYMTPAVVDVPVVWQRQAPVTDRIMDVPVVLQRQGPAIQAVQQTVEVPQVQYIDNAVDVPVVVQRQVPSIETVQKTVEVPQTQHIDKVADVPVARPRQTLKIPKVQRTVETPRIQFMEKVVDVPVMAHSQTLSVQIVQKTVEVPQIQFIDKLVDSHVNMRCVLEVEHVVPTPVTEHMASAPAQSHADVSAGVKSAITWTKELTEIRQMVEFLVRRERKLDVKTDVAVRRLERLEREQNEQADHDREASMTKRSRTRPKS